MRIKSKVLTNFTRMKDDELIVAANTIIGAMTDNTHYPQPSPTLEHLQKLLDDFAVKLAAARKRGSPEDTALKNESKLPLREAMHKLGYHVNLVAEGRLSTLLSSGFPVNNQASTILVPLAVRNVRVRDGRQSGQVRLDFEKQHGVRVYEYRYRRVGMPEQPWSDRFYTTSSQGNVIAPMEVGDYFEIQVRAVNTQGPGDWSDSVRILVR